MKIDNLVIKGLFSTFDYNIQFDNSPNPFIITGLNGYGKTTILTIINSLSEKDLYYFYILPFTEICFRFDNKSVLTINSLKEKDIEDNENDSDENLTESKIVSFEWSFPSGSIGTILLNEQNISKAVRRLGFYRRTEFDNNNYMSDEFYRFIKDNSFFYRYFLDSDSSRALIMMFENFKSTFIQAQRTVSVFHETSEMGRHVNTFTKRSVLDVSEKLGRLLQKEYLKYLNAIQTYDSSFIDNLLEATKSLTDCEYNKLRDQLENKMNELLQFGLVRNTAIKPYNADKADILTVYIESLQKKLQVYDNILPKLRIFRELVSSSNFVNKTMTFEPSRGIVVKSLDGTFLDVNKLSSGEQNEIILLYNMIFEVGDNSLLLIDEPEISLHVAWQNHFIDNLETIAENKKIQIIVATHSPQIIGDRWESCFDLCEQSV
jgi:ABC-type lipoprotein export system ATPase subunit